jgi:hypothetical protein
MRLFFSLFLYSVFILPDAKAQETLPGFSVFLKTNGKVLISWRNSYPVINQISIQRSADSLRNFTTLITVPDPRIAENGFVDPRANGTKMFYRIFILFPNSKYMFTKSRRAVLESVDQPLFVSKLVPKEKPKTTAQITQSAQKPPTQATHTVIAPTEKPTVQEEEKYLILPKIDNSRIYYMMDNQNLKKPIVNNPGKIKTPTFEVQKMLFVKRRDSVIMQLAGTQVRRFSDSLVKQTKDTLFFVNADTLQIKPYIEVYKEPKEIYKISPFVFAAKDGNVMISLADFKNKKYFVSFYEMDSTKILEVKEIKDPELIIDKSNFGHSGWFRFELYEDGKLKEKNKLLIPRE